MASFSSSSNTFGTFLDTIKTLEGNRSPNRSWPEQEVFKIAKELTAGGDVQLKQVMNRVGLPQDVFLGAVVAGRDKGLFEIDEAADEPVLKLTKLGRSFVS